MIDKLTEQKIKDAASIVDVIGDFITLRRKGVNYECLCPFHDDHHIGSFVVHPAMNCYRCFSCDQKGGPVDFLMNYSCTKFSYPDALRYLATKYGIPVDDDFDRERFRNIRPAKPRDMQPAQQELPKRLWPATWVDVYTDLKNDNFINYAKNLPWDDCQRNRFWQAVKDYKVGHAYFYTVNKFTGEELLHEWTIWWMIDDKNQLHNGHMMKFYPPGHDRFGHRDKTSRYSTTWLHARMKYSNNDKFVFNPEKEKASYCMFGQHLMTKYPNAKINIVESEKTALLMAAAYGNNASQIWMACAGLQNLTRERMQGILDARREIVLFPDRDAIDKWIAKAGKLNYPYLSINTKAVREWWLPEDGPTADIADIVIRMLQQAKEER